MAALARLLSMVTNASVGIDRTVSADGIITGGGVAIWMGDNGTMVVTQGEDIVSLWASSARTAFR